MPALKIDQFSINSLIVPKEFGVTGNPITQSLLGNFQTCRRRFLFSINRWTHPDKERKTGYGTMNHELLDKIYSGIFFKDCTYNDLPDLINHFLDRYKLPNVFKVQEQEQLKALSQASLECYIKHYKSDFSDFRLKAIERQFEVAHGQWILRGKIDGCLADKTGASWNLEHKNYSRVNEEALQKRLSFDLQNLFYLNADYMETGQQLKGVKYNILRKPEVKKFDRPKEMYDHVKGLITKNPDYYFIRYEVPYTKTDLKRFQDELVYKLEDLQECFERVLFGKQNILNVFYKNECACDQPYQCDYLNACSSGKLCGYVKNKYLFPELDTEDEKPARPVNIKKPKLSGATTKQIIVPPIKKARKL